MFNTLNLTDFLSLMFGVYLIAAAISLLLMNDDYPEMMEEFIENGALGYLTGVVVFALGVVLVRVHNDWSSWQAGFVSLVGWGVLIEGVLMLAIRRQFVGAFLALSYQPVLLRIFGFAALLAGIGLIALVCL